jgi:hypothetical protein
VRAVPLLLALSACGRSGFDERAPLEPPAHVPASVTLDGAGSLVLGTSVIDTTSLTIDGASPVRGQLAAIAQLGGGPELALLQAEHITISDGAMVRVVGTRGLVILARTVDVGGSLDASAGAGAALIKAANGVHEAGNVCDSGGGGGGHGTRGGTGGDADSCTFGGPGGAVIGDDALTLLVGGAAGGDGVTAACGIPPGGGGGGALQLSASERVSIAGAGAVLVGGGGGVGGLECGDGDAGAGGGGGAGGAIYIEAPVVVIDGVLLAHGGGGGAGGNGLTQNGPIGKGGDGAAGTSRDPAVGGVPPAPNAGIGGAGGTGALAAGDGMMGNNNGGGGGGGAGRIVIIGDAIELRGFVSPAAR